MILELEISEYMVNKDEKINCSSTNLHLDSVFGPESQ